MIGPVQLVGTVVNVVLVLSLFVMACELVLRKRRDLPLWPPRTLVLGALAAMNFFGFHGLRIVAARIPDEGTATALVVIGWLAINALWLLAFFTRGARAKG